MDPANAKLVCGAECGIAVTGTASGGTEHWSAAGATAVTVVTSGPTSMRSARCFRLNSVNASCGLTHTFASAIPSGGTGVARMYLYFTTLPTATSTRPILGFFGGTSTFMWGAFFDSATNTIKAGRETASTPVLGASGVAVTTGVWYRIDVKATFAATHSADVQVDGVACTQVTQAVAAETSTRFDIGWPSVTVTSTHDYYIDDVLVSGTSGDYPIGAGTVVGLYPNADGTHSFTNALGDFADGTSGATTFLPSATDVWQSLDNPLVSTAAGSWVADLTGGSAEYVEFRLDDLPLGALVVNGVMVVTTTHSASTTANNQVMQIVGSGGAQAVYNLDLSESTITIPVGIVGWADGAGTVPWTPALINSAVMRWGNSSDVNPDPYLDGVCLEVDVLIYRPLVVQVNQAVQRMAVM